MSQPQLPRAPQGRLEWWLETLAIVLMLVAFFVVIGASR